MKVHSTTDGHWTDGAQHDGMGTRRMVHRLQHSTKGHWADGAQQWLRYSVYETRLVLAL
jgi:hypothetical protein